MLMKTLLPHPRRLVLFLLLNALDLVLTRQLVEPGSPHAYESNPVADWWLHAHGWAGLAGFKAAMVVFAACLFVVVARRRPALGRRALTFSCLVVAGVVLYGGFLLGGNYSSLAAIRRARELDADMQRRMDHCREWRAFQERLDRDLVAGHCSLAEAVERLAGSERARDPVLRKTLRDKFRCATEEERLAAFLVSHAVNSLSGEPRRAEEVAVRLEAEYRAKFGGPPPFPADALPVSLPALRNGNGGDDLVAPQVPPAAGGGRGLGRAAGVSG